MAAVVFFGAARAGPLSVETLDLSIPRPADCIPVADLDNDGHRDCAWVETGSGGVGYEFHVRRGIGAGHFSPVQSFAVSSIPSDANPELDLRDFDQDGFVDAWITFRCATCDCPSGTQQILFGRGAAGFSAPLLVAGGPWTHRTLADFDADGVDDVVAMAEMPRNGNCSNLDGAVAVWRRGTTEPAVFYPGGDVAAAIAVGDLDGDGRPDIAVPAMGQYLPNAGGGVFGLPAPLLAGSHNPNFHLAHIRDLDDDGDQDVVLANLDQFLVLLNDGSGGFSERGYAVASTDSRVLDLDADGVEDDVLDNDVELILMRHVAGDEFEATVLGPKLGSFAITAADFDGDGRPDFVDAGATDFGVFCSAAVPPWSPGRRYAVAIAGARIADYDEDGAMDLVVPMVDQDIWIPGLGTGAFAAPIRVTLPSSDGRTLLPGDVDGDGVHDAVVSRFDGFAWSAGTGDAGFGASHTHTWSSPTPETRALALADLDGDHRLDVVAARQSFASAGDVAIALNQGGGSFALEVSAAAGIRPTSIVVDDLDRDGYADILVNDTAASAFLLYGHGDGTFESAVAIDAGAAGTLAVGDFDADGRPDIAAQTFAGTNVVLHDGSRSFAQPQLLDTGTGNRFGLLDAADLEGDGRADLVVFDGSSVRVARSLVSGWTVSSPVAVPTGTPRAMLVRDFDDDAIVDLVLLSTEASGNVLRLYRGTGNGSFDSANAVTTDGPLCAAAQVAGSTLPDLVVSNQILVNRGRGTETSVLVSSFTALAQEDGTLLRWTIAASFVRRIVGVDVERAAEPRGPFARLTQRALSPQAEMSFHDPDAAAATTRWYRLVIQESDGSRTVTSPIAGAVQAGARGTMLVSVYPGAIAGSVEIRYALERDSRNVRLGIYDVRGRLTARLRAGAAPAGSHLQTWTGLDARGDRAARGVYLVKLDVDGRSQVRKFVKPGG